MIENSLTAATFTHPNSRINRRQRDVATLTAAIFCNENYHGGIFEGEHSGQIAVDGVQVQSTRDLYCIMLVADLYKIINLLHFPMVHYSTSIYYSRTSCFFTWLIFLCTKQNMIIKEIG